MSLGDGIVFGLCALAALITIAVIGEAAYQIISGARPAISKLGLGFLTHSLWAPNFEKFGAAALIYGTVVSSAIALVLAVPIGVAIGLFLSMMVGGRIRAVIGPIVELLAAIPSVILGFWGILVLSPFVQQHVEPWLNHAFGFIPLFGPPETTGSSLFTAGLILTIMVVPIIASLSRDLFLTVPRDQQDGAAALGCTRWEVIRGVVLPTTAPGVIAASVLGLGTGARRGDRCHPGDRRRHRDPRHRCSGPSDTLASRIAEQFPGAEPAVARVALLPRADPARDRPDDEPFRAVDRPAL